MAQLSLSQNLGNLNSHGLGACSEFLAYVGRLVVPVRDVIRSVTDDGTRIGGREMSYKPRKLGHVNIFVRNAARARDWYEDLLGLHTYGFTPGRAAFMTSDLGNSHEVALVEVGEDAPGQQKGQVGLNHMAWYMDSLDDLKELYFRIKAKNIKIERVSDHGHAIGIYIRDPDGNGIEVSYEMPSSEWGHDPKGYMIGGTQRGRLSGPWDEDIAREVRVRA
jgi:catechol 2,3-dioxygenase